MTRNAEQLGASVVLATKRREPFATTNNNTLLRTHTIINRSLVDSWIEGSTSG